MSPPKRDPGPPSFKTDAAAASHPDADTMPSRSHIPVRTERARAAAELLEIIADSPDVWTGFDEELRVRLRIVCGRIAYPNNDGKRDISRAFRRRERGERRAHDTQLLTRAGTRSGPRQMLPRFVPASAEPEPASERDAAERRPTDGDLLDGELQAARHCYVCKQLYRRVHHHYHAMCSDCAGLNWEKRQQSVRLDGRVAVVTGARIKIGYHIALKLLRAGARVIATTRFPRDAAERFAREPDFAEFRERLDLHGLDLRHVPSVERFASHLFQALPRLDFLINNAAQTVRRPPAFYSHLVAAEERPFDELGDPVRLVLAAGESLRASLIGPDLGGDNDPDGPSLVRFASAESIGLLAPARLSQLPLAPGDLAHSAADFPVGFVDGDEQQVDLRDVNSWRLSAAEVSTPELLEVHLVNAIAPFLLVARLRPLLARENPGDRHVVNVSAMEAKFSRWKKTDRHPHTNMAKAALNMLTRTSAADFARDRVWMNSVDTGWVTDEDPVIHVARKQAEHDFHPPLDSVDGAARVLDPIFSGLRTGEHPYGVFFKDYRSTDW